VNACRPFTFALEAADELQALAAHFECAVEDHQQDGIEGDRFDRAAFLRGFAYLNRFAYASLFRDEASPEDFYTLPRATIERFFLWNRFYDTLVKQCGDYYYIANMAFTRSADGRVQTTALWPDDRGIMLPRVDVVYLRRGEADERRGRQVGWDDLAERMLPLRSAPSVEPVEHWAVVEGLVGRALDPFFGKGTKDAAQELVSPSNVHAAEDVQAARSSDFI
jgi:hypothetical protein